MDKGHQYEYTCKSLLEKKGFVDVVVTKGSGDQGVDVLASKDGITYAIQCKYLTKHVGNDAVQQVYAGKQFYNCDVAVVMTNNTFTEPAIELAKSTGVKLWAHNSVPGTANRLKKTVNRGTSVARIVVLIIVIAVLIGLLVFLIRSPLLRGGTSSAEKTAITSDRTSTSSNSEYILPDSDSRYYSESELSGLSKDDLRLARNEIYARHGRKFDADDLQNYFDGQAWYKGTIDPDDFQDSLLNEYEKANVDTIMAAEESK